MSDDDTYDDDIEDADDADDADDDADVNAASGDEDVDDEDADDDDDDDVNAATGDEDVDDDDDDDYNRKDPNLIEGATAATVLEYITKSVVDDPEQVEVDSAEGRRGTVSLEVHVADDDMGRVIGKRGRVANSIRTVVRAAAARDGVEVDVEFVE